MNFCLRCKRYQAATPWQVQGKVVVITGASSGIGEELAYEFARKGAILFLCARRVERLLEVSKLCNKYGATKTTVQKTDVTRDSDITRLIEMIDTHYGKIDCLVLNAGVAMGETFEDLDFSLNKNIMDINYIGSTLLTHHALPLLRKADKPRILAVSSLLTIIPSVPLKTAYTASKCAVKGFYDALQAELIDDNIFVSIAYPGLVATEINKNRLGKNPKHVDFSYAMSAEKCAKIMVDGTIKAHKEINLSDVGKIGRIIEGIFPELLFHFSYKQSKQILGKDECT